METQATEPSQPAEYHTPIKAKFKINKYFTAIVILAIIAAAIFYLMPAAKHPAQNITGNETPPVLQVNNTNITPEAPMPELNATGLLIWGLVVPESLNDGTPLAVSFNVNNTGNENITSALVTAKIDDSEIYSYTLSNFEVNASQTLGFTFLKNDANYPKAGTHTLKVFINGNLSMTDTFEITTTTFAPDMEIRSFLVRPEFVNIGQNATLIAYVRNIGNMDAQNASIRFFANEVLLSEQPIVLPLQTTQTLNASWLPSQTGTYTLKVIAYASGEVYTKNNEYGFNVTVGNSTA
jgi:hypothetical protein